MDIIAVILPRFCDRRPGVCAHVARGVPHARRSRPHPLRVQHRSSGDAVRLDVPRLLAGPDPVVVPVSVLHTRGGDILCRRSDRTAVLSPTPHGTGDVRDGMLLLQYCSHRTADYFHRVGRYGGSPVDDDRIGPHGDSVFPDHRRCGVWTRSVPAPSNRDVPTSQLWCAPPWECCATRFLAA